MTKPERHLATLDAMRGIAAFAVCLFHLSYHWQRNLLPHAYLAVDFFFVLSGFVIARAYEERLAGGMGVARFVWLRLIRLYPLILLAVLLGLADEVMKSGLGPGRIALEGLANAALLPTHLGAVAHWPMFPLNPPTWSLFYELLINVAFAVALTHLRRRGLYVLLAVSALWLVCIGLSTGQTGRGESLDDWQSGTSRVIVSFSMGMLLHRLDAAGALARLPRISGIWLCAALLLCLAVRHFPGDWIYNLLCVLLLFPALVGLGGRPGILHGSAVPAALWLGRISYPLYVLHSPLLLRNSYRLTHDQHGLHLAVIAGAAMLGLTLLSWAALVLYDEPLRGWLGRAGRVRQVAAKLSP